MGLHRPGSKRGLTHRRSAALQDRWDREESATSLADANIKIAELQATIAGKDEQIELLKSLLGKKVK